MILVASLVLILADTRRTPTIYSQADKESVRRFVQDFYDWYAPLERHFDEKLPMDAQEMVIQSQGKNFKPGLLAAFAAGKKQDSHNMASGLLVIGEGSYDPFLGDDGSDAQYKVNSVTRHGQNFLVDVGQDAFKYFKARHAITVEVEKSKSGWQFSNFIYDDAGWNLRDYLKEVTPQPPLPPKRTYESGGLSVSKIRWLKKEKLHCVIPTYIPAGMNLSRFAMTPMIKVDDASLEITWSGKNGAQFTIEMVSDGIGDVIVGPDREIDPKWISYHKVINPVLGKMVIESLDLPSERDFGVNWIDLGLKAVHRFVCLTGEHMPLSEAMKIAKGLRFLK